jgi:hypothetical protein
MTESLFHTLTSLTPSGALLLFALAWPALLALLWAVPDRRRAAPLAATLALVPALVLAFVGDAAPRSSFRDSSPACGWAWTLVGRPFVLLTALLWSVVMWHACTRTCARPRRAVSPGS